MLGPLHISCASELAISVGLRTWNKCVFNSACCWDCFPLIQLSCSVLVGGILPCLMHFFVMFGYCLWEACSFLKQDRAGVDSGQVSGRARAWEEWMEGKLGFGCNVLYESTIYFQFKKKRRNVL